MQNIVRYPLTINLMDPLDSLDPLDPMAIIATWP
jgi:hypothetical protein